MKRVKLSKFFFTFYDSHVSKCEYEIEFASKVISLPNDNFFHWSKSKAFADDKINVTYKQKLFFEIGR